ncbi:MAG: DUF881 domain-containing protein [Solirubrobacterales bacterium]
MKRSAQLSIALVCLILGLMMAIQFRTNENNPNNQYGDRYTSLTIQLTKALKDRDALAAEVLSLRDKINQAATGGKAGAAHVVQEEIDKSNMMAGIVPVTGQGVILTMKDSARTLQVGEDPNLYLIHDEDLLKIVNEIKGSGAEAISVNGNRITAMTEIRCAGTTILVNTNKIAPPFIIQAVGDPDVLESSLRIKGGWLETLELWGIQVKIDKMDRVEIPAYSGAVKFTYAKPMK